jgi:hypothetical protein
MPHVPPLVRRPPISRTTPSPNSSALHPQCSTTFFTSSAGISVYRHPRRTVNVDVVVV